MERGTGKVAAEVRDCSFAMIDALALVLIAATVVLLALLF